MVLVYRMYCCHMKRKTRRRSTFESRAAKKLLAAAQELTAACPLSQCNPEDCPLYTLRKLPIRKRLQWLSELSESDLAYLTTYHSTCMAAQLRS